MHGTYKEHEQWVLKESLTVGGLIELLSKYPEYLKIMFTWESTINSIVKSNVYFSKLGSFIYLDADGNSYKHEFAEDPSENEE